MVDDGLERRQTCSTAHGSANQFATQRTAAGIVSGQRSQHPALSQYINSHYISAGESCSTSAQHTWMGEATAAGDRSVLVSAEVCQRSMHSTQYTQIAQCCLRPLRGWNKRRYSSTALTAHSAAQGCEDCEHSCTSRAEGWYWLMLVPYCCQTAGYSPSSSVLMERAGSRSLTAHVVTSSGIPSLRALIFVFVTHRNLLGG